MVISIIGILAALLFPALGKAKEKTRRISCLNNLKQLGVGSMLFAGDNNGQYTGCTNYKDDDLNWLYRGYVTSLKSYTCPSTRNEVHPNEFSGVNPVTGDPILSDLTNFCMYSSSQHGHSYEQYGYWLGNQYDFRSKAGTNGIKKTEHVVVSRRHQNNAFGLAGSVPGTSKTWLMVDGDEKKGGVGSNVGNYPDAPDHHGADGVNGVFADGHAEWIARLKGGRENFLFSYELSQDENRITP